MFFIIVISGPITLLLIQEQLLFLVCICVISSHYLLHLHCFLTFSSPSASWGSSQVCPIHH